MVDQPDPASRERPTPPSMADAAEMLWVVLANVSGGDWTQQSDEWQEAAERWRDNYFAALRAAGEIPSLRSPDLAMAVTRLQMQVMDLTADRARLREQITSLTKERDTLDAQIRMVVRASDVTRVDRAALREQIEQLPHRKRAMTTNSETEWFKQVDLADVLALLDAGQEKK